MIEEIIILKKPIVTEKSLRDAGRGIYTFEVNLKSDKQEISQAIEKMFDVHVKKITTVKIKGKKKRSGKKRLVTQSSDIKKARVMLAKGEKIQLFEVGQQS